VLDHTQEAVKNAGIDGCRAESRSGQIRGELTEDMNKAGKSTAELRQSTSDLEVKYS
jgi:hypothetical protein